MSDGKDDDSTPWTHQPYGQQPNQPPQYPQPGYGQPYGQAYPPQFQTFPVAPNHPSANTALVLGIVSLGGAFVCLLPILVGPFAWYMGAKVRREIDAEPQRYGGRSEASAGMVLGIVSTVLLVLGILAIVAVIAIGVAASSTA